MHFGGGIPTVSYCSCNEQSDVVPSAHQGVKLVQGLEESGGIK